eukprot:symbB.v1.2.021379.t1/scaffold1843.1/size100617/15
MRTKTKYVGERLKFFFGEQKEATVQFMLGLQGSPEEHMFSRLIPKQAQVIQRNDTMKRCIFEAFDKACDGHRVRFMQMWCDFMDSMFQSPLMLLKSGSMPSIGDDFDEEKAPTFETTKARIAQERRGRGTLQSALREKVKQIPDDDVMANESVKMVQRIIEQTFAVIRSVVADHMQLYSESFFLLPMLRRLEGVMAQMELQEEDKNSYRARKSVLDKEKAVSEGMLGDLTYCVEAVQRFKVTYGTVSQHLGTVRRQLLGRKLNGSPLTLPPRCKSPNEDHLLWVDWSLRPPGQVQLLGVQISSTQESLDHISVVQLQQHGDVLKLKEIHEVALHEESDGQKGLVRQHILYDLLGVIYPCQGSSPLAAVTGDSNGKQSLVFMLQDVQHGSQAEEAEPLAWVFYFNVLEGPSTGVRSGGVLQFLVKVLQEARRFQV